MKRVLTSYRWRRRLLRLGVVAVAVGGLVVIDSHYSYNGTASKLPQPQPGAPQLVAPSPKTVPLRAADARAVRIVARRFIESAVLRRHLPQSWSLVAPALRQHLTRAQWATGAIPIVPYPAGDLKVAKWNLAHSYRNSVGLSVLLQPKPRARSRAELFDLELVAAGPVGHRRWLVSSWIPAAQNELASLPPGRTVQPSELPKSRLGAAWLVAVVLAIVGLIAAAPTAVGVRGWLRSRRADRAKTRPV